MLEIKADNIFAYDELYNRYSKKLYNFAYSILKSIEESENIVQDVYLNLWENRLKVKNNSSVKYYVFTIAYNSSISLIRKKVLESKFIEYLKSLNEIYQEPVDLEFEYSELTNRLDKIVNALPQRQKEVFIMNRTEGLKYQEIADRLSISVNTIENHMSRALKNIREKLGVNTLIIMLFWTLFV